MEPGSSGFSPRLKKVQKESAANRAELNGAIVG
jgi:hypothetical protein